MMLFSVQRQNSDKPHSKFASIAAIILALYFTLSTALRVFWLLPLLGYGWLSILLHLSFLFSGFVILCALLASEKHRIMSTAAALFAVFSVSSLLLVHDVTGAMLAPLTKSRVGLAWFTGLYCNGSFSGCFTLPSAPVRYLFVFAVLMALLVAAARPVVAGLSHLWYYGKGAPSFARTARRCAALAALAYPAAAAFSPMAMVAMDPIAVFMVREPIDAPPELLLAQPGPVITPSATAQSPRPLVLIIVDALRADHVETRPGYPSLTPFLQRQRAAGNLQDYRDAVTMCSASYCGITAILGSSSWTGQQQGRPTNLMDALAGYGYESHLVLSAPFRPAFNYSTLFGPNVASVSEQSRAGEQADDRTVLDALRALKIRDTQRTAIVIQLMSAHPGGLRHTANQNGAELLLDVVMAEDGKQEYQRYYNEGVKQADSIIEGIVDILQQKGLGDALILITADHGEGLGGDGGFFHGSGVNVEVAKVPMLIIDPREARWPEHRLVSTLDAAPTLLRAIGAKPPTSWEGMALQDGTQRSQAPIDDVNTTGVVTLYRGQLVLVKCAVATGTTVAVDLNSGKRLSLADDAATFAALPRRRNADRCR
jgi:hypothetical protein